MDFIFYRINHSTAARVGHSSRGFSLIEVLVAMLILSVGILGVAGMQAISVQESNNLYFRTQADLLINDMVDRMRVNRVAARGAGTGGAKSAYDAVSVSSNSAVSAGDCSAQCNSAALAQYDIGKWGEAIASAKLPAAIGTISHVSDAVNADTGLVVGSVYTVQLFWDEDRDGAGVSAQGCQAVSSQGSSCRSLTVSI